METNGIKHLEHYFYSDFHTNGKFDFPIVKKQMIDLSELKLIRYSSTKSKETTDRDATIHFFEYDDRYDEIWKSPDSYMDKLRQYKQLMTPDFSMYSNIALALQIFNTFRTRWLGAYWQRNGLTVIPTVSWSDEWSYEFCFDGIEPGSVVALSTMGCMDVKNQFMTGYIEMCKAIDPKLIICYAKPFEEMGNYADVIEVPYQRNVRIAHAIERNED